MTRLVISLWQKYLGGGRIWPDKSAGGLAPPSRRNPSVLARNPSVLIFVAGLALFTLIITLSSAAYGIDLISTSFIKTLGKTLCLCLIAIAMDLVWGYAGILSLGHFAFFGLGGYMIGMWLMYARTREIVVAALANSPLPPTPDEIHAGITNQIFGVVGSS